MMKNETTMTKLTPAQVYALQVKADRRAAAIERRSSSVAADNARINAMFITPEKVTQRKVAKVVKSTKKVRWTDAELNLLIDLYLKYVDPLNGAENGSSVTEEFQKQYPERTGAAIVLGLAQIKALDAYHPAAGLTDTSQALVDKLYSINPERFPGGATREEKVLNALDVLLAGVRS